MSLRSPPYRDDVVCLSYNSTLYSICVYELPFSEKGEPGKPGDTILLYTKDKMGEDLHNSTNKFDHRRKRFSFIAFLSLFLSFQNNQIDQKI